MGSEKINILVVDDDVDVVWGIGKCLTRSGFSVTTCPDGAEAIEILKIRSFDVVVTDILMPRLNGIELINWVRENRPSIRVVVMTGVGSPSLRQLTMAKGAILYLEKPVDPVFLIQVLSSTTKDTSFWGTVDEIDILDYVQLMLLTGKQVVLEVRSRDGARGVLFIRNGAICHAECCALDGEEAVYCCMGFEGGSFSNLPWYEPDRVSINKPGEFLLIEAARKRDEMKDCDCSMKPETKQW
jgi:CheY-like chemotaxis protein